MIRSTIVVAIILEVLLASRPINVHAITPDYIVQPMKEKLPPTLHSSGKPRPLVRWEQ